MSYPVSSRALAQPYFQGKAPNYANMTFEAAKALLEKAAAIPEYAENEAKIDRAVNQLEKVLKQVSPEVFGKLAYEVMMYECGWNPADQLSAVAGRRMQTDPAAARAFEEVERQQG